MREKCDSHDEMCEQLTETRISQARVEEQVKIIPKLEKKLDIITEKLDGVTGFAAGYLVLYLFCLDC